MCDARHTIPTREIPANGFAPMSMISPAGRPLSKVSRTIFRNPALLLAAIAFFTALIVQSGELGSSDTAHRLQATHSFWTSEPAVFPAEYPEFGIHGRGGKLYGWY